MYLSFTSLNSLHCVPRLRGRWGSRSKSLSEAKRSWYSGKARNVRGVSHASLPKSPRGEWRMAQFFRNLLVSLTHTLVCRIVVFSILDNRPKSGRLLRSFCISARNKACNSGRSQYLRRSHGMLFRVLFDGMRKFRSARRAVISSTSCRQRDVFFCANHYQHLRAMFSHRTKYLCTQTAPR